MLREGSKLRLCPSLHFCFGMSDATPSDGTPADDVVIDLSDATPSDGENPKPAPNRANKSAAAVDLVSLEELRAHPVQFLTDWWRDRPNWKDDEVNRHVWSVLQQCKERTSEMGNNILEFQISGNRVSKMTFRKALSISNTRLDRLVKARLSNTEMPSDMRLQKPSQPHPQQDHADKWFAWCWHVLAQPLAESKVKDYMDEVDQHFPQTRFAAADEAVVLETFNTTFEWVLGPCPGRAGIIPHEQVRVLLKQTFQDFYDLYVVTCTGQPVSVSSFKRAWVTGDWDQKLKFLPEGVHSGCPTCSRLVQWAKECTSDEDRNKVRECKCAHVHVIMLDRAVCSRNDEIAERSMSVVASVAACVPADVRHGEMNIDGMDQAHFKTPRWKFAGVSKDLEPLWRPQLHVHGTMVPGCLETYYLCCPDIPKNGNMQCTCMLRTLHLVLEELENRGTPDMLPYFWRFHYDNAPAEGRNETCFTLYSVLVSCDTFDGIDAESSEVGHTHNIQDQRFATAATTLASSERLETPQEFQHQLEHIKAPTPNTKMFVEILDGTYDWKSYFAVLDFDFIFEKFAGRVAA